jgi:hypothetical protein
MAIALTVVFWGLTLLRDALPVQPMAVLGIYAYCRALVAVWKCTEPGYDPPVCRRQ